MSDVGYGEFKDVSLECKSGTTSKRPDEAAHGMKIK
jgi:hypothetical protein